MPVPVATMMCVLSSEPSGRSMTLPVGPVMVILVPGVASHRKFEQMPFLAGSSAPSSGHQ